MRILYIDDMLTLGCLTESGTTEEYYAAVNHIKKDYSDIIFESQTYHKSSIDKKSAVFSKMAKDLRDYDAVVVNDLHTLDMHSIEAHGPVSYIFKSMTHGQIDEKCSILIPNEYEAFFKMLQSSKKEENRVKCDLIVLCNYPDHFGVISPHCIRYHNGLRYGFTLEDGDTFEHLLYTVFRWTVDEYKRDNRFEKIAASESKDNIILSFGYKPTVGVDGKEGYILEVEGDASVYYPKTIIYKFDDDRLRLFLNTVKSRLEHTDPKDLKCTTNYTVYGSREDLKDSE